MSLQSNLSSYITRVGTEFKALRTLISGTATGNVSGLNTTATDLVAAVNEVKTTADAAAGGGTAINDAATNTTDTWSSSKINTEISTATSALVNSSPAALDTLNELAAALGDDADFATTTATSLGQRIRADAAQSFSTAEQLQASTNIGLGDPETDLVALFNTAIA